MGWIKKMGIVLLLISSLAFPLSSQALADDDEHEEKYEHSQKVEDDEYERNGEKGQDQQSLTQPSSQQDVFWNIWTRTPKNNPNSPLPLTTPGELQVMVNGQQSKLYFIPQEGQLLVSGESIAKLLEAQVTFYPKSKILVITKEKMELIMKDGSNAIYENRLKVPLPVAAFAYEKTIYLPLSAAANALGYRINWDETQKMITMDSI